MKRLFLYSVLCTLAVEGANASSAREISAEEQALLLDCMLNFGMSYQDSLTFVLQDQGTVKTFFQIQPPEEVLPMPTPEEIASLGFFGLTYSAGLQHGLSTGKTHADAAGRAYAEARKQLNKEVNDCINGDGFVVDMAKAWGNIAVLGAPAVTADDVLAEYERTTLPLWNTESNRSFILAPYYRETVLTRLNALIEAAFVE